MTFQTRLLTAFFLAVLLPLIVLAIFIRNEMTDRLTAQYENRVASLVAVIEDDLEQESNSIEASLRSLRSAVIDDNRFRRAALDHASEERRYLLDYAGKAMQLTGLSMLQIQDKSGRIISSGHFRNEYDRLEPELPELLASTPRGAALVQARAPDAPFIALARVDSFRLGDRRFTIIAGVKVEERFLSRLAREGELIVSLIYPGGILSSDTDLDAPADEISSEYDREGEIVQELSVPFIDPVNRKRKTAHLRVTHPLTELEALRQSIDRWFMISVASAGILAVLLAGWLASRISQPLLELADKTSRIDLDRLDIEFGSSRKDEIGALSRLLGVMTDKLRVSAVRIKEAERRATLGEMARQVNHDIKNGLIPIRNVFHHLFQLARDNPDQLPAVFSDRQKTLDSSISYLENLASNYARLSPRSESRPCNVNAIVRQVIGDMRESGQAGFQLKMNLNDRAVVHGDRVALRRILENLVGNAIDSLERGSGIVTVSTEIITGESMPGWVRITVEDTGIGMSREEQSKVFDDFYTTKDDGIGLGLSIVRRLVMDLDGSIHVESDKGSGSSFIVELPGEFRTSIQEETGNHDPGGQQN